jgi:hypothetical protein
MLNSVLQIMLTGVASVNDRLSIEFQVKIDGWLATQSVAEQLGL